MKAVPRQEGVRYAAHVANRIGLERAQAAGVDSVIICLAASDEVARREDDGCLSTSDCMKIRQSLSEEARAGGLWVRVFLTYTWGSPYEAVAPERVQNICEALINADVDEVCLADNLGAATPADVDQVVRSVIEVVPPDRLALHFHDNRGMAVSNVLAGLARGISVIDVSAGGLGAKPSNCRFLPDGAAMVATEDVLFLLHGMGIETGVDIAKVRAAGRHIAERLDTPVLSRYSVAGPIDWMQ
jgi:hydroxymethylglutaryl-CoA lyase